MADNIQEEKTLCGSSSLLAFVEGVVIFLLVAFPIVEIAVGAAYLNDCPVAPILPVYLIVLGVFCLLLVAMFAILKPLPAVGDHWIWSGSVMVAFLFTLGWFFYGTYVVYTMYPIYHDLINRPGRSEGSYFLPEISGDTENTINPISSISTTHLTTAAPDYTQSTSSYNSHFPPTTPNNMPIRAQNQTQSTSLNQTTMTTNTKQTLMNLIQTMANQANPEHLNTPHIGAARSDDALYCDPNLYLFVFCTTTIIYLCIGISCAISSARKKC